MDFFTKADAGAPLSLHFLCEVFDLDLVAVQVMARERIRQACQTVRAPENVFSHRDMKSAGQGIGAGLELSSWVRALALKEARRLGLK